MSEKLYRVQMNSKGMPNFSTAVEVADIPQGDSVSRRYLLAEIDDLADEFSEVDENGLHSERWCGILDSKGIIVNAPSVSDRPQGEWIGYEVPSECSVCGHCWDEYVFGQEIWYDGSVPNYCPHCGARMKGADDESKRD